jgi:hypothetical protein
MKQPEFSETQEMPAWLAEYQRPMTASRRWFHYEAADLPLASGAAQKYDAAGRAKAVPGLALVAFLDAASMAFHGLDAAAAELRREYLDEGIADAFAWLPPSTWHVTIADLVVSADQHVQRRTREGVLQALAILQRSQLHSPCFYLRRDPVVSAGISVVVLAEPKDEASLRTIHGIRCAVAEQFAPTALAVTPENATQFIGHITIAYIVKALDAPQYGRFRQVMQRRDQEAGSLGDVRIDALELRQFSSMEDWGGVPLAELRLAE